MTIDLRTKYRTVEGLEVRLYALDGMEPFPIHGALLHGTDWHPWTWTKDGKASYNNTVKMTRYDLVPEYDGKYLKSMKELLQEFPGAKFDTWGQLCCSTWDTDMRCHKIHPTFFEYLGGLVGDVPASMKKYILQEWIRG